MTDLEFATTAYVEPLLPDSVRHVIERERPELLPRQPALNLTKTSHDDGTR